MRGQQQTAAAQAFLKTLTTPTHPLHEEIMNRRDELVNQMLKMVRSWAVDARKMVEEVTQQENIREIVWVESDVRVRTARIGGRDWRDRAEMVNMSEVYEWLYQEDPTVVIATDGSLREDITAWGGAVWREGRLCFEWSAAKERRSSSFRAESEALKDALFWIGHNTDRSDKVVILTDSLSLVSKMESGVVRENWLEVIRRVEASVTVCYIPGHSGLKWNEKAYKLAGSAQPIGMLVRTPSDVLADIKRKVRDGEKEDQRKSWSVERLEERGRHYGEGACVPERGRRRAMFNQLELGVLTRRSLQNACRVSGTSISLIPGEILEK